MARPISHRRLSEVAYLCLEGGVAMLENGAETSRVEETIGYLAGAYGVPVESMVTPTGVTVSVGEQEPVTRIARIHSRTIDLCKVAKLNALSRELILHRVELDAARTRVEDIRRGPATYGPPIHYAAACIGSAAYTLVVGGSWTEMLAGAAAGLGLKGLYDLLHKRFPNFLYTALAAFLATMWGGLAAAIGGLEAQKIILGAILPMMPGLSLVSAVRDLIAGDLISGQARGAEAFLIATAIAVGVLSGLSLERSLGW